MKKKKLIREQLDASLKRFSPLLDVTPPPKGWIRAIRDALGMTAKQVASRLGVAQQSVARIEKEELAGSVTIKTMRRVAETFDCVFVYGFVPRDSLENAVKNQAEMVARKRLSRVSQTMRLENQELSRNEQKKAFVEEVQRLVQTVPSHLWDE